MSRSAMVLKVILHRKLIFSPLQWNHITLWSAAIPGRGWWNSWANTRCCMKRQPQSHAWFPRLWPHQPHNLRVNQKPAMYRIISFIIVFSFVSMAKFKALIKFRRHPSSRWAWENKHSCNESGFRPNSFSLVKETIDSRTARSQLCLQPHGRGSAGNLHGIQICQGGKQKKN